VIELEVDLSSKLLPNWNLEVCSL